MQGGKDDAPPGIGQIFTGHNIYIQTTNKKWKIMFYDLKIFINEATISLWWTYEYDDVIDCLGGAVEEEKDEMTKLEERARQLAAEAIRDQAKPDKGILFVRYIVLTVSPWMSEHLP